MNKKNLIQVVIIVACLSASAIVIYNNFFKKPPLPPQLAGNALAPGAKIEGAILPNGTGFDLNSVKNSTLQFDVVPYPKVDYPDQVGADAMNLIRPLKTIETK